MVQGLHGLEAVTETASQAWYDSKVVRSTYSPLS
jgi:hypothetical protein